MAAFIKKVKCGGVIGLEESAAELLHENARGDGSKVVAPIELKLGRRFSATDYLIHNFS